MRESQHNGPEPRLGITVAEATDGSITWHQPVGEQFVDPRGRFATGGLAVLVAEESSVIDVMDGLLTLKGLCLIHQKNAD